MPPMRLRRLTQDEFRDLRASLRRTGQLQGTDRLLQHLAYLGEEALRVSGPLPADGTYDDPESAVQAFIEEKGWGAVVAALRETTTPERFAKYMRAALTKYCISVGRRQGRPRLWDRTAKLLKNNADRRYISLERNSNKRLSWWGRFGWPLEQPRHGEPGTPLYEAGHKALEGLPLVQDSPRKRYAPKILSNAALNDLVSGTMDGVQEGLTLEHYGWLFPQIFPVPYGRIDAESYEARKENLGNAGELPAKADVDQHVDFEILFNAVVDEDAARRLAALRRHNGDPHAAAAELGDPVGVIIGDRVYAERYLRQRNLEWDDFERALDRMIDA